MSIEHVIAETDDRAKCLIAVVLTMRTIRQLAEQMGHASVGDRECAILRTALMGLGVAPDELETAEVMAADVAAFVEASA